MRRHKVAINRDTFRQLARAGMAFLRSPSGGRAKWLGGSLLILMLVINGLNVLNSYVGRDFISSIEHRNSEGFALYAWLYVCVFALSTLVAVLFRYSEERLGLLWRDYLTHRIVGNYLDRRIYLHLEYPEGITNPDQRMTEDVRQLTTTTLSFILMILNGTLTTISFSGVLWTISPLLFGIAVLYAATGSAMTIYLGRPLVRLNYEQSDFEANFRSELIRVREKAEGIALTGNEDRIRDKVMNRIDQVVKNLGRIIRVNRHLNYFTTGYNYMIQLIPTLVVAPLFMRHGVEFGVIGQASMAFATLLGAFSLVVTQFQAISSYASVITRLSEFVDASEMAVVRHNGSCISSPTGSNRITYLDLTVLTPDKDQRILLKELNASFVPNRRVLVYGPNQAGRAALFKATAGVHDACTGTIVRPPDGQVLFLPERPYLPQVTLRELLIPPGANGTSDQKMRDAIRDAGLESVVQTHGGFDAAHNWMELLSLEEQQWLSVIRTALAGPAFVLLDQADSTLAPTEHGRALKLLTRHGITCISFGNHAPDPSIHDSALELKEDGSWAWSDLN
jgi:putative ATP-binding cassette transporter